MYPESYFFFLEINVEYVKAILLAIALEICFAKLCEPLYRFSYRKSFDNFFNNFFENKKIIQVYLWFLLASS